MKKANLAEKFDLISDYWSPHIVGELNGQAVKIAKVRGEFPRHQHDGEDELFMLIKGQFFIELDDQTVELNEGELLIVPKGVPHRPYAPEEAHIMMFEPLSTVNTGDVENEYTKKDLKKI